MNPALKKSIVFLIVVIALLAVAVNLTKAQDALAEINLLFLAIACIFFLLGVGVWIVCWAYLIKKQHNISYSNTINIGFSSVFGALTPIQLGADALRSIQLKDRFNIPYSDSLAASMLVKGFKFFVLAFLALVVLAFFAPKIELSSISVAALASGFFVIMLAALAFLLPLKKSFGAKICGLFERLAGRFPRTAFLARFFKAYSLYLEKSKSFLLPVFVLACISWFFEFLAVYYSFVSLSISLDLSRFLVFVVIVSILERAPFIPRGIGLVEIIGYNFLALPGLSGAVLSASQIGAVIIAYDLVRLVVPTLASIIFAALFSKRLEELFSKSASK